MGGLINARWLARSSSGSVYYCDGRERDSHIVYLAPLKRERKATRLISDSIRVDVSLSRSPLRLIFLRVADLGFRSSGTEAF